MTGDTELDIRLERIETNVLSGVVFEITDGGRVPLEGVELYCDACGSPDGHTYVRTDGDGFYILEWTANGVHSLFVTKAGYEIFDPNGTRDAIGRILIATSRPTLASRDRYTSPMPPAPSSASR